MFNIHGECHDDDDAVGVPPILPPPILPPCHWPVLSRKAMGEDGHVHHDE